MHTEVGIVQFPLATSGCHEQVLTPSVPGHSFWQWENSVSSD